MYSVDKPSVFPNIKLPAERTGMNRAATMKPGSKFMETVQVLAQSLTAMAFSARRIASLVNLQKQSLNGPDAQDEMSGSEVEEDMAALLTTWDLLVTQLNAIRLVGYETAQHLETFMKATPGRPLPSAREIGFYILGAKPAVLKASKELQGIAQELSLLEIVDPEPLPETHVQQLEAYINNCLPSGFANE
ncbi:MAG: hypothetical protein HC848_11060 [Limnobacter sp.]|nr:hypothetical protein [Limnobacter sp.]